MKKRVSIIIALYLFVTMSLMADFYVKQKIHSDEVSMMGQTTPEKNDIQNMWLGDNKMAMHSTDQSFIIDLDKKLMLMINHQDKSYVEMTLPLDMSKYFPEQISQMMQGVTVSVEPTGETQKIGEWNCKVYNVTMDIMMMTMKQKIFASKDVPFDWKNYAEKILPQMTQALFRLDGDAVKEFLKIDGYQIRTEMTMSVMGTDIKSWTEVEEITKKSAPAGTYSVPDGYTKKDKFSMMDMQRR